MLVPWDCLPHLVGADSPTWIPSTDCLEQPPLFMQTRVSTLVTRVLLESTGQELNPGPQDLLITSGFLDSMSMVNLVIALQGEFGVMLDMGDMSVENFDTVESITKLVESRGG